MENVTFENEKQQLTVYDRAIIPVQDSGGLQTTENATALSAELIWLETVITNVLSGKQWEDPTNFTQDSSYSRFIEEHAMGTPEKLLLMLGIASNLKPQIFDVFLPDSGKRNSMYGGVQNRESGLFIPTLKTAIYLLSGGNTEKEAYYYNYLDENNFLFREQVMYLRPVLADETYRSSMMLKLDNSWFEHFYVGKKMRLDMTENFPADLLQTDKTFDDLVLDSKTVSNLQPLMRFLKKQKEVFSKTGVKGKINGGYIAMFYGRPGTGKTLTASVMGKHLGVDVYCINLSRVVSKYIGETQKNLETVFNRLGDKECILFWH